MCLVSGSSRSLGSTKKITGIWDDLTEFFYAVNPAYRQVGARRKHLVDTGIFDHHDAYDATYATATAWGDRRWATPGVIVDGELVTTDLHKINMGVEEFVEHRAAEPDLDLESLDRALS